MNKNKSLLITLAMYIITMFVGWFVYIELQEITNDIIAILVADVVATIIIFIGSIIINNSSLYDPYWSVIPMGIVILWVVELESTAWYHLGLLAAVMVWGIRLTSNWQTDFKGFHHEDFRYVDFRASFGKLYWVISFLAIHLFPTLIVLASLYPLRMVLLASTVNSVYIVIGILVMILGAVISYIADGQVRTHKLNGNKNSIKDGLWKYSRHPNYAGELLFWTGIFIASLSTGFNLYASLGMIGMYLLFNFYSVPKMEQKLLNNKEDYQNVINEVPRFLFWKPKM